MTIAIRKATSSDSTSIAQIYSHYIANTVVTFEEEPVSAETMAGRIADVQAGGLPWLVAESEGAVVGYAYATKWKARAAYRQSVEASIYLAPGQERRGIGTQLYRALLAPLKAAGFHVVIGGAALPNSGSVALHERMGFEPVGTFRQVGFKLGRWVDVTYWQIVIG